jgi:antitoxin VapB
VRACPAKRGWTAFHPGPIQKGGFAGPLLASTDKYILYRIIYMEPIMALNVNNPEADALTRRFARMVGVGITDAIIIAMKEAITRRRNAETPLETAARLREKHGVALARNARTPLRRQAFDKMWGDRIGDDA